MTRLPTPGGDSGNWGTILNTFLSQVHASDGTLKTDSVTSDAIAPNAVTSSALAPNAVDAITIADGSITETLLDTAVQTKLNATAPVTSVASKTGDVSLAKTDVGLDQVDNTSDATKNAATATLTNKTLTSPKVNTLYSTNNAPALLISAPVSSVNYLAAYGNPTGSPVYFGATGSDTNIPLYLSAKGTGSAGAVNIGNNGGNGLQVIAAASTANNLSVYSTATGGTPSIYATGTDTNVDMNLTTKGSGIVKANNVAVATISNTQTLTNKTISGANNTITDIPVSATPYTSRLVCTTAGGGASAENGSGTWAKLVTFVSGVNYDTTTMMYAIGTQWGVGDVAIFTFSFRNAAAGVDPTIEVNMVAKGGALSYLYADSIKAIGGAYGEPIEIWVKKRTTYGGFKLYELLKSQGNYTTITYNDGAAWQSAVPTGTVSNVSTNGVTAAGIPVVTTTDTQTLTNKSLTSPTLTDSIINGLPTGTGVASAATASTLAIRDSSSNIYVNFLSTSHSATSRTTDTVFYSSTDNFIRKNTATGFKTSLSLDQVDNTSDSTKNSATATLTNKTISGASNTLSNIPISALLPSLNAIRNSGSNDIPEGDMETADLIKIAAPNRVLSTEQKLTGTQSLRLTGYNYAFFPQDPASGAVMTIPCSPGDVVSAEGWVYGHASNQDTTDTLYLRIDFKQSDDSWLNYYTKPISAGDTLKGKWTKMGFSYIAPATTIGYTITIYQLNGGTTVPNNVYYWDGVRSSRSLPSTSGRLVGTTAAGGAGAEDGGGTWSMIAEYTMGTTYMGQSAVLNIVEAAASSEQAEIHIHIRSNGASQAPTLSVEFANKPIAAAFITTYSFKLVATGATFDSPVELWMRKNANGGRFSIYETTSSSSHQYNAKKYFYASGWQSAIPSGVSEVTSSAAKSFGVPIATTTDTQTLTNKTLTNPKVSQIDDTNGAGVLSFSTTASAVNYLNITNAASGGNVVLQTAGSDANAGWTMRAKGAGAISFTTSQGANIAAFMYAASAANYYTFTPGATGVAPVLKAFGSDTNVDMNLATKGTGVVKANGNPVGVKVAVPASATAAGEPGQWAADANYHYTCIATNTWVRSVAATW